MILPVTCRQDLYGTFPALPNGEAERDPVAVVPGGARPWKTEVTSGACSVKVAP